MAFDNNILGELRPNQIITTFGPGSVVDAVKDSVIWHSGIQKLSAH